MEDNGFPFDVDGVRGVAGEDDFVEEPFQGPFVEEEEKGDEEEQGEEDVVHEGWGVWEGELFGEH